MKKRNLWIGCIAMCAVLATGCGGQNQDGQNQDGDAQSTAMVEATPTIDISNSGNEGDAGNSELPSDNSAENSNEITMEEAKKIALKKAELTEKDGTWKKEKTDQEDGRMTYELEFVSGEMEYEFEIDAENGNVLEYEKEPANA